MADDASEGAILFDIDGTLVDSNYLHVFAWIRAFDAVGQSVDASRIHRAIGMGSPQLLSSLLGEDLADRLGDEVKSRHAEFYGETANLLRPFAQAQELVAAVAKRAKAVLATSASPDELELLRTTLQVDEAVAAITSAQDVESAKPEPDIVNMALTKAGVPAERAVFVGDTVWDVEAAGKAGVACVAVLSGGIGAAELSDAGAAAVYTDAAALLAALDDSPLAAVLGQ